ncbi:MAG TPA: cysteine peptidase family C39 domain-containing protein [Termitinemataceae bacterium]|uniref:C39 family peptidase n=1 Tax=Treponema sp. J25 TaxID=2094121 RepID=UPI001047F6C7|nr:cysteine peptidase family C39 domain-containing protein [Treponema sp. J25]TCW60339.1 hypothetical protein C5O22_11775 [Treponema sp. J25]HOJ98807.1 cysteine peptidase family C39 domain-containing protein [Termitinemataceae bacterium]HOM23111.1 cysteine peptidase family C39 domain-containing protein [Termitinemataceae bacterium]HPP99961.1 cysteine peptidase family C39 domain-containing protein [Termitinemataceae bacterium]
MAGILSFLLLLQQVQGLEPLRFSHVAEQGYDTSCGLSVLSDLVSRYWNYPLSEETLVSEWFTLRQTSERSHTNDIGRAEEDYTISFKDMQDLLARHGFVSRGFRFSYDQLVKAARSYAPLILHFADQEGHFVLCLAAEEEYLVIADPAEGVYWLSRDALLSHWQGYALLIQHPTLLKNQPALERTVQEAHSRQESLQFLSGIQGGGYR